MQAKVGKVLIGKDISRTATLTGFPESSSNNLADGEILVLDKNRNIMTAGSTYADSNIIYLVEGLSGTYNYANEAGTAVTGARKLLYSDAIDGAGVVNYLGKSYTAATEEVWNIDLTGWVPVVGTEYGIRIVFKDLTHNDYPTQYTKTYRYTAATTAVDTEGAAFAALINSDVNRRVLAAYSTTPDILSLTALAYDDNDEIDSMNEYAQVMFEVGLVTNNFKTLGAGANAISVYPSKGVGTYRLVRDEEYWSQNYEGLNSRMKFRATEPTMRTVKNQTYDCIVIQHKNWITSADRREVQVDITTKVFLPDSAGQTSSILATLNTWMESLPKGFNSISL